MDNPNMEEALRRRIDELELLRRVDLQLAKTLDHQAILHAILDGAIDHLPAAYKGGILLYRSGSNALHTEVYATRDNQPFQTALDLPLDETRGIVRWAFVNRRSARVDNVRDSPWVELYVEGDNQTVSELDVPLVAGDESLGVINIESRQERGFSQSDQEFLELLAGRAALAVRNSQEFSALRERRLHELEVLRDILLKINRTLDLPTVLQSVLKQAFPYMPLTTYKGSIFLHDPSTNSLTTQRYFSNDANYHQTLVIPLEQDKGIIGWAFKQKKTARVNNVHDPEWSHLYLPVADNILAELDVPLMDGDEIVGIINFESRQENAFSQADQDFLETLAPQAVLAIKSAQLYESQGQALDDQHRLIEIIDRITNQDETERIFEPILDRALELTNATTGTLMLYDPQQDDLYVAAQLNVPAARDRRQQMTEGIIGRVAMTGRAKRVNANEPEWTERYFGFVDDISSELAVPILDGDVVLGVLNVEHPELGHFTERHEVLLVALAGLVRIVLQKLKAVQRMKDLEALSSVGRLRLELAHQLGNGLGRVRSYVNIIERELGRSNVHNAVIADHLAAIMSDVTRVMNLGKALTIGDLTQVLPHPHTPEKVEVGEFLTEWAAKLQPELPPTIRFECTIAPHLRPVHVIRQQIHVILEHLVLNAQQAMPHGGVLTLRASPLGTGVAIEVQDTGVGIPRKELGHIFELFHSTKGTSGYGLNAALTYAHENGGELKVKSVLGEGSIFTLVLPSVRTIETEAS